MRIYRTAEIAALTGVHPNTVRRYEEWGFLPPIDRATNGYRQYTEINLHQMRLARMAMRISWMGGDVRQKAYRIIYRSAAAEYADAYEHARLLKFIILDEERHALAAANVLDEWTKGNKVKNKDAAPLTIGQTARHLSVTVDTLRNWERNGLIQVPRNPSNGYRLYGKEELDRLVVIRTLRKARYSLMSILRMIRAFDEGQRDNLATVLDTPNQGEDVIYVTDQWLTTLSEMKSVMDEMIELLEWLLVRPIRTD